jgi:hypothetical protein
MKQSSSDLFWGFVAYALVTAAIVVSAVFVGVVLGVLWAG